jgi:UDP-N-acetylmuramate dehydrogenase
MQLERGKSLRTYNTFGIDATAKLFAAVQSADDFRALRAEPACRDERLLILGGGSNLLFTRDFDGLVVKNSIPGIELLREDAEHVWLRAGAGEVWHELVLHCVGRNWSGLENLSLIPGQVGAAPMQNIGAYGVEMESTCESVEAVDIATGEAATFSKRDCEFGYRDSVFKHRYKDRFLITAVTFRLAKTPHFEVGYGDVRRTLDEMSVGELSIRAVSDAVIRIRSSKLPDPKVIGNAGSFFKNPVVPREQFERIAAMHHGLPHYPLRDGSVKVPAGWLIERCGWKGRVVGQAGVHDRQALVLVNRGGASGDEILRLARDIQDSVRDRFGIDLVPEVNLV